MDKRRFFIVLFTCLLILPCSKDVNGADWTYCCKSQEQYYYYHADSINFLPKNIIRVWMKTIPRSEEDRLSIIQKVRENYPALPDNWSYSKALWEINCKDNTWSVLAVTFYDNKEEVIKSAKIRKPEPEYAEPDTMPDLFNKSICSLKDSKKKRR